MTSQYDAIGSKYNMLKELPTALLETENLKDALLPYLAKFNKPRVLDLACGTGFYSQKLLSWGASYVLGIDLSQAMIDAAKQRVAQAGQDPGSLRFLVGNALTLGRVPDEPEPFDIVLGVWLLNYAASEAEMTAMFRSVAANLRPDGGVFVGVVPHGADDLDAYAHSINEFEKDTPAPWGISVHYYEKLASGEGWKTEVVGEEGDVRVTFRNFHLRKDVFEQAARQGGMNGKFEWRDIRLPPQALEKKGEQYWKLYYEKGPHFGVIVVEK